MKYELIKKLDGIVDRIVETTSNYSHNDSDDCFLHYLRARNELIDFIEQVEKEARIDELKKLADKIKPTWEVGAPENVFRNKRLSYEQILARIAELEKDK